MYGNCANMQTAKAKSRLKSIAVKGALAQLIDEP